MSGGFSVSGKQCPPNDTVGIVGTINHISSVHQQFLGILGGLGILIGDDQLPESRNGTHHRGVLQLELIPFHPHTFDYQFITNPAYNTIRGPVSVLGMRLHTQF